MLRSEVLLQAAQQGGHMALHKGPGGVWHFMLPFCGYCGLGGIAATMSRIVVLIGHLACTDSS